MKPETLLLELSPDFARSARAGGAVQLTHAAEQHGLALHVLFPKKPECTTFYLQGAGATSPAVVAQMQAVPGVTLAYPFRRR